MKLQRPKKPFSPLPPHVRAGQYVAKIPGAVSGSGGHNQTFSVAVALVHGFALPEPQAWPILMEYGATCSPPWSLPELRHKLASAVAATSHQKPRGHLLGTQAATVRYMAEEPSPRVIGRVKVPELRSAEAKRKSEFEKGKSGNPTGKPKEQVHTKSCEPAKRDSKAEHSRSTVGQVAAATTITPPAACPQIPSGYCPTCWSRWARALRPGCCYCTGDVKPFPSSIRGVMKPESNL